MFAFLEYRFDPDGASAPTSTRDCGSLAWISGYAARTMYRYVCGETGVQRLPLHEAWGCSHSGRFGSFHRMYSSVTDPYRLATAAANCPNCHALGRYRGLPTRGLDEPHSGGGPPSSRIGRRPCETRMLTARSTSPQL